MKYIFSLHIASILLLSSTIHAQKNSKLNFVITPEFQLLNGASKVSTSIHLRAGISKANNQLNIGAGIDYYGYRTVPIGFDFKHFFGVQKNKPFVYAGAGYNVAWLLDEQKKHYWIFGVPSTVADYNSGFTYHFGMGYGFLTHNKKGLQLSIGINSKSLKESYFESVFDGTRATIFPVNNTYTLSRLAIGIAYSF